MRLSTYTEKRNSPRVAKSMKMQQSRYACSACFATAGQVGRGYSMLPAAMPWACAMPSTCIGKHNEPSLRVWNTCVASPITTPRLKSRWSVIQQTGDGILEINSLGGAWAPMRLKKPLPNSESASLQYITVSGVDGPGSKLPLKLESPEDGILFGFA